MKKLYTALCIAMLAMLAMPASAQRIYLIKGDKVVDSYSLNSVDYMSFEVPDGVEAPDFAIDIEEVGYNNVKWTVTPSDPDMYYYSAVYTPESLQDRFENSVDKLCEILYHDMQFIASMASYPIDDFMKDQVLAKGQQTFYDAQQGPDYEYIILAFGCSIKGEATTDTYTGKTFKTPAMPSTGLTVGFDINTESNNVAIKYTPSDNNVRYITEVRRADEEFDPQSWMNTLIWRGSVVDKTPQQVYEENTVTGPVEKTYQLDPDAEYVVYSCSVALVAESPIVNSEVSSQKFTSGPVKDSNMTFDVSVTKTGILSAEINVKPSTNDSYSWAVIKASDVEGVTIDRAFLQEYGMNNGFLTDIRTNSGEQTITAEALEADTEYIFVAFGWYSHVCTTDNIGKVTFHTEKTSDPTKWTATFSDIKIADDKSKASVDITVNYPDVNYVWFVVPSYGTDDQIKEAIMAEFKRAEDKGYNYVEVRSVAGNNEVSYWPEEDDTEEVKFVAVVANTDFEFLTPIFSSASFKMGTAAAAPAKAPANAVRMLDIPRNR